MQREKTSNIDTNKDVITTVGQELENTNEPITNREEILKQMIFDCRKMFVLEESEDCFGTWLLIDDSDLDDILPEQTEPDCVLVLTSNRYFVVCYDETFQKIVSFKETPLTFVDKVEVGPNPLLPPNSSYTLRIHYLKNEQTSGYYHQFRGTYVQVFNSSVKLLKNLDQINDYVKTIGQLIVSIHNCFTQKTITLNEKTLNSIEFDPMNSLPDDVEPLQRRMSFSATDTPPLSTINNSPTPNNRVTLDKIKNLSSRFSSLVTRQAAPTINKLTAQAKQLPINETVTSLLKVINEGQSLIRGSPTKLVNDDGRASPTIETNRKKILQDKFDERKKNYLRTNVKQNVFFYLHLILILFTFQMINKNKLINILFFINLCI